MKRIFTYLGYALGIAAVIAVFTTTDKEQCKAYVTRKMAPDTLLALQVEEVPFKILGAKLFSTYVVSYYKPSGLSLQQQANNGDNGPRSAAIAAIKANSGYKSETYIGIFNSFWSW